MTLVATRLMISIMRSMSAMLFTLISPVAAIAQTVAPPVGVIVSFSPRAHDLMFRTNEHVTVSAEFYREPMRLSDLGHDDNDSLFHVGEGSITVPFSSQVVVKLSDIRLEQRQLHKSKRPLKVIVNVSSARRSSEDNLLFCGSFQDDVVVAVRTPIKFVCKLIDEQT